MDIRAVRAEGQTRKGDPASTVFVKITVPPADRIRSTRPRHLRGLAWGETRRPAR